MVESILLNDSAKGSEDEQAELKNSWVPRFLKSGGLDKLTTMMEKVLQELKKSKVSEKPMSFEQE